MNYLFAGTNEHHGFFHRMERIRACSHDASNARVRRRRSVRFMASTTIARRSWSPRPIKRVGVAGVDPADRSGGPLAARADPAYLVLRVRVVLAIGP